MERTLKNDMLWLKTVHLCRAAIAKPLSVLISLPSLLQISRQEDAGQSTRQEHWPTVAAAALLLLSECGPYGPITALPAGVPPCGAALTDSGAVPSRR